jgi:protein TonB
MNHTARGFQISFLLHAVSLLLVFGLSHSIKWERRPPIVIDFSVADGAVERTAGRPSTAGVVSSPFNSPAKMGIKAQKQKPIARRSAAEAPARRPVRPAPVEEKVIARAEKAPVDDAADKMQADSRDDAQPASDAPPYSSGQAQTVGAYQSGDQAASAMEGQRRGYIKRHFAYIRDMIMQNLSYPMLARKMGWSGRVVVSFTVLDDGQVEDVKVVETSGFDCLDKNAIETINKTAPFPRPPVKAELIIPIVYRLS